MSLKSNTLFTPSIEQRIIYFEVIELLGNKPTSKLKYFHQRFELMTYKQDFEKAYKEKLKL